MPRNPGVIFVITLHTTTAPKQPLHKGWRCTVCADSEFSIKLAQGTVAVDSGVLRGKQAVSFAHSLSQGHSQQACAFFLFIMVPE